MRLPRCPNHLSLLALIGALNAFLPPSGWALCLSADGHVEVEPVDRDSREPDSPCRAGDDCGTCVDIVFATGAGIQPVKSIDAFAHDAAPKLLAPSLRHFDFSAARCGTASSDPAPQDVAPSRPQQVILIL